MGYIGDIAKLTKGLTKEAAEKAEYKVFNKGIAEGLADESTILISDAARRATQYSIYGAAGLGVAGAIYGAASPNQSIVGGTASGIGLGALGGASAGAIAAGIAKSMR